MNERSEPTHKLTIVVPLNLTDAEDLNYQPVDHAIRAVLAVTRLAVDGVTCGDLTVSLDEASTASFVPCSQCGDPACDLVARP